MGQVESSQPDDANCFRACLRDKKQQLPKQPASPYLTNDQYLSPKSPFQPILPNSPIPPPLPNQMHKNNVNSQDGQTSLDARLKQQVTPIKAVQGDGFGSCWEGRDGERLGQGTVGEEEGGVLGLQSKFSSSRKTTIKKHGTITRITSASEGLGAKSNWEKEGGSSDETNNKSQGTSSESRKSRTVLLNKIEEIKQKYYQRELEIEIYQNQDQYQQNLQEKVAQSRVNSQSSTKEVKQVTNIREKIADKLNKRKLKKPRNKEEGEKSQNNILSERNEQLELYSKNHIEIAQGQEQKVPQNEEKMPQGQKRKGILDLSQSIRSVKNQDMSLEQRMQFSGYTQQDTLHQIRECDQEEQDYKSKMSSRVKPKSKNLAYKLSSQASIRLKEGATSPREEKGRSKRGSLLVQGSQVVEVSGEGEGRGNRIFVF